MPHNEDETNPTPDEERYQALPPFPSEETLRRLYRQMRKGTPKLGHPSSGYRAPSGPVWLQWPDRLKQPPHPTMYADDRAFLTQHAPWMRTASIWERHR